MAKLGIHKRGHGIARIIGDTVPSQKHKELMNLSSGQMQAPPVGQDIASALGADSTGMGSAPAMKKGGSVKIGNFLETMGQYKNLGKSKDLHMKKGGSAKWIQSAIKKPGSLRKTLGVKAGEKIPASKLSAAANKSGITGRRARLAMTLRGLKK
jgi:hypothetical protein